MIENSSAITFLCDQIFTGLMIKLVKNPIHLYLNHMYGPKYPIKISNRCSSVKGQKRSSLTRHPQINTYFPNINKPSYLFQRTAIQVTFFQYSVTAHVRFLKISAEMSGRLYLIQWFESGIVCSAYSMIFVPVLCSTAAVVTQIAVLQDKDILWSELQSAVLLFQDMFP